MRLGGKFFNLNIRLAMDALFQSFKINYYVTLVMYTTAIVGVIISVRKRKKFPILRFFPIYFTLSLVQSSISELYNLGLLGFDHKVVNASINVFVCFEFFVITNFFFKLRLSRGIQRTIIILFVVFYTFTIGIWTTKISFFASPYEIYILEALFTIPLSLTYFFFLFKDPPTKELVRDFTFWISTGILFYFTITLPFFLVWLRIDEKVYYLLYTINYLSYAIFFSLIIKGYLCKPEITK